MSERRVPRRVAAPYRPVNRAFRATLVRALAAATGGLLLYAASAPRQLWWLAPVAFALLALALHGRSWRPALGLGSLFGLGFYLPLLPWVGIYVGPVPWLALAGLQAALVGAGSVLIARVLPLRGPGSRTPGVPPADAGPSAGPASRPWLGAVCGAACWVATEALAARAPFGGFAWGKVAFTQADGPFLRLAALGGPALVGFAVVLTGFGLAALAGRATAAGRPPGGSGWRGPLTCALLPVLVALGCPRWLTGAAPDSGDGTGEVVVAAVQGNVPRLGLDFNAQRRAVLDNHVRRTLELADDVAAGRAPAPAFVLWPENASDIDPLRNADAAAEIGAAAERIRAPILVGTVLVLGRNGADRYVTANSVLLWDPGRGPVDRNDKRRVQPFGEYLPWRGFFRIFSEYADRAGFFVPGTGPGVLRPAGIPVGVAICWEIAFDDLVGESVRNGAQLLAVPSNNATFGISEMTYQQLAMSRIRAVQFDRAVTVAATSGASALIDPHGTELRRSDLFRPAALVMTMPLRRTTTLAARLGSAPEWVLVVLGLAAAGATVRRRADERGGPAAPATREEEDG